MEVSPSGERGATIRLDDQEAAMMRDLADQLRDIVKGDDASDPVVGRFYPPAHEVPEEDRKYRDLVGSELKNGKARALESVQLSLGDSGPVTVSLGEDEIDPWLTTLTDMRLAIGTRMDVTEEKMNEQLDPNDPDAAPLSVLHWLGWIQQSLIEASSGIVPPEEAR
ncbi:MAG: DUF2017 family protein [Actinomycetota bacterium]